MLRIIRGAEGCTVEDIKKHGIFESIGDRKYLVKVGHDYVQSESGPFFLLLPPSATSESARRAGSGEVA